MSTFLDLLYIIVALVTALTLHEFAHALVADLLGDRTARQEGRLSLNPLTHIDPIMTLALPALLIILHSPVVFGAARPVPFNPWAVRFGRWGAAMVAAAGPAMNFLLAALFAGWMHWLPVSSAALPLFLAIISINIAFLVFNLIPIPPLDGSRIVYAVIPPVRPLFDRLEHNGMVVIFALLFIAGPVLTPFIAAAVAGIERWLVPGLTGLSL